MKKIFTFVSAALVAMAANAQVESWDASSADIATATANPTELTSDNIIVVPADVKVYPMGTYDAGGTDVTAVAGATHSLKSYQVTASTANVDMKFISTPNSDAAADEAIQLKGGGNMALNTDVCNPKFEQYIQARNGNPSFLIKDYYELNSNGDETHRISETYYQIGGELPSKGAFVEFTTKSAGELKVAVFVNKGNHNLYIVDEATKALIPNANIKVGFYYQNNGFTFDDNGTTVSFVEGTMADDYILQHTNGYSQNRPAIGYVTFNAEAGKKYMLFCPKSQVGLYGFSFDTTAGIADLAVAKKVNADAPIYNLAGQKVGKNFKGVVIQNGKKFIQK
jgi:hypothetical protein